MKINYLLRTMSNIESLKIYGANFVAAAISLTTIDAVLKIALLVASIAYTVTKTIKLIKDDPPKEKDDE